MEKGGQEVEEGVRRWKMMEKLKSQRRRQRKREGRIIIKNNIKVIRKKCERQNERKNWRRERDRHGVGIRVKKDGELTASSPFPRLPPKTLKPSSPRSAKARVLEKC